MATDSTDSFAESKVNKKHLEYDCSLDFKTLENEKAKLQNLKEQSLGIYIDIKKEVVRLYKEIQNTSEEVNSLNRFESSICPISR